MTASLGARSTATVRPALPFWALLLLGAAAGYLSGLFGVGGGIIVVPVLVLLGLDQRIAAGSSVAAILPTSIVGAIGYGVSGNVDWLAGLMLAVGVVLGAQIGSYLLSRLSRAELLWGFVGFLLIVAASLWLVVPERDDNIELNGWMIAGLIALGVITGILSGLLGVGGGIVVVPTLVLLFGASDLIAKGTSLLMMVPGSISATVGNVRRKNFDLRVALIVGLTACATSPLGLLTATKISPLWSNVAFSILLAAVSVQLVVKHLRSRPRTR